MLQMPNANLALSAPPQCPALCCAEHQKSPRRSYLLGVAVVHLLLTQFRLPSLLGQMTVVVA